MKTLKFLSIIALTLFAFTSCSDDDTAPTLLDVEAETISNLFAPQEGGVDPVTGQPLPVSGEFTKFDFETGTTTTSDTDWDIAFRGTTIIVNGGESQGATDEPDRTGNAAAYIAISDLAGVTEVNESLLVQDTEAALAITPSSDQGWYNYSGFGNPNPLDDNLIRPIAGRILVFRTRDGRYAKVEILSYYQAAPASPNGFVDTPRCYTFNYVFQPNDGVTTFE